jgi:glutamyl-tRNA synthetase/glutamyl-Q tRNA(Asp) synthetase
VVNAIYVWGLSRATGGHVHLRIEDHDQGRCRDAFVEACLDDLEWLGFEPDSGLTPLDRQTERTARYEAVLDSLRAAGLAYGCTCSRREIAGRPYSGRCRALGMPLRGNVGSRLRLDDTEENAFDLARGELRQRPAEQCGDLLMRDRHGHWTYQFAVTVDDLDQGVTLVIRGADLVDSTGRQVALARALGRRHPPVFLHHGLVRAADGAKLSKSTGAPSIHALRSAGQTAAQVIGAAAAAAGLVPTGTRLDATDTPALFG